MKLIPLIILTLLLGFASSAYSDDLFDKRDHLFPAQMMFEVSIPLGGSNTKAVEFSLNYNNFNNLSSRNVIASYSKQGDFELPVYNRFGEEAVDWAIDHPYWASAIAYVVIFGIPNF